MLSLARRLIAPTLVQPLLLRRPLHQSLTAANITPKTELKPDEVWGTIANIVQTVSPELQQKDTLTVEEKWKILSDAAYENLVKYPPANAYSGRTVAVGKYGFDGAWRKLNKILAQNSVARELRLTAKHEKKGYKRRRLKSERWQKQFSNEVRNKVDVVRQIRYRNKP